MLCYRDGEDQWEEGEGKDSTAEAIGEADGESDAGEVKDEGDSQLPVNTLFYGVRGQQVSPL